MKFAIIAALLIASVSASPVKKGVNPSLVPPLGHKAGINPTRMSHTSDYILHAKHKLNIVIDTGNCDGVKGANGKPIAVPCSCPPDEKSFLAVRIDYFFYQIQRLINKFR